MEFYPCPACNGDGQPLGQLGNLIHYRCRHCGMEFSRREADRPYTCPCGEPVTLTPHGGSCSGYCPACGAGHSFPAT